MVSSVASKSLKSGTFAPAIISESGPPSASTRIERLTPFLARSVGFGPKRSPQNAPCPLLRPPPAPPPPPPPTPPTPHPPTLPALHHDSPQDPPQPPPPPPPQESAAHGRAVGALSRKMVPLQAPPHQEDNQRSEAHPSEPKSHV